MPDEGSAQSIKSFEEKPPQSLGSPTKDAYKLAELEFAQNYDKIVEIYKNVKNNKDIKKFSIDQSIRLSNIDYTDKILITDNCRLKVTTRDEHDNTDLSSLIHFKYTKNHPQLLITQKDLLCLFNFTNWRNVFCKLLTSDERSYMRTFLEQISIAENVEVRSKITIVIQIELNVAKIIVDTLLSSASDSYNHLQRDFTNLKKVAILKGVAKALDDPSSDLNTRHDYFYEQHPSIMQVLKLISVLLDLQEQTWLISKMRNNKANPDTHERDTSR